MKIAKQIEETVFPDNYKELPPLQQLGVWWGIVVAVLSFVKLFTGEKADAKIDEIIKWGEAHVK